MDILYDNLENYHDEKIIKELKNENKELKNKLEEYSSAMARLQTDFENLSSGYKKLETNYSSLLKTARAEIERKTEMIKNLNLEKDMLVLKTLQRPTRYNFNKRPNVGTKLEETASTNTKDTETIKKPSDNKDDRENHINYRVNPTHSEEAEVNFKSGSNSNEDKKLKKSKSYKKNELPKATDNISKEMNKDDTMSNSSSKDGNTISSRKSVQRRIEQILSSDDDFEYLNLKNTRFNDDTRHHDKYYRSKDYRHTDSYNSYDSSNTYRNQTVTSSDNDMYKNERYESDRKYRIQHHRENYNKHRNEYYEPKGDWNRQRALRSPPINKYKRSKSRDRYSRDRANFERDDYMDYERQSPSYYDNYTSKYNVKNDFNEPSSKRQKTNIYAKDIRDKSKVSYTKSPCISEVPSCQITNNDSFENTEPQYIVEGIKKKASSPVESPVVIDQTVVTHKDEVEADVCKVGNTHIEYKKSLEVTEELVNDIYMDIDKPKFNVSLESGEIPSSLDIENDTKFCENLQEQQSHTINPQSKSNNAFDNLQYNHSNSVTNAVYKIPKIKKPHKDTITHKNTNLVKNTNENAPIYNDFDVTKEKPHKDNITNKNTNLLKITNENAPIYKDFDLTKEKPHEDNITNKNSNSVKNTNENAPIYKDFDVTKEKPHEDNITNKNSNSVKNTNENAPIYKDFDVTKEKPHKDTITYKNSNLLKNTNENAPIFKDFDLKKEKPHEDNITNKNSNSVKNTNENAPICKDFGVTKEKSLIIRLEKCNIKQICFTENKELKRNIHNKSEDIINIKSCLPENASISMKTLASDLELSDDASDSKDSCDMHDKNTKKILTKNNEGSANLNKNQNKVLSGQNERNNIKCKEKSKSVISKEIRDNKSNRDNKTKRKSKKKTEQNDESCFKTKKQIKEIQEITKLTDDQHKGGSASQNKSKINEIFGDSCSLITPDDLGISPSDVQVPLDSKYNSDFDNAQDVADVSVDNFSKVQFEGIDSVSETTRDTLPNEKNSNPINITMIKENPGTNVIDIEQSLSNMYENTMSETQGDSSNVVNTIIISTGVQPNCIIDNSAFQNTETDVTGLNNINVDLANMENPTLIKIKAPTTSSPQKEATELCLLPGEPSCSTNPSKVDELNLSCNITNSSSASASSSKIRIFDEDAPKNETDEPDVRIFVKRRRKVIRKS